MIACPPRLPAPFFRLPATASLRHPSRRRLACRAGLAAALLTAAAAHADPSVQLGYAVDSKHDIEKVELALAWDSGFGWGNPDGFRLGLNWEANVARWRSTSDNNPRNPWEFGLSPIFRLAWQRHNWVPFLELSIGVRLLTDTRTSDDHTYSTAFQFSDMAGIGVAYGRDQRFAAGYRYQHISNAGIKTPNPGTDFHTVYLRYRF